MRNELNVDDDFVVYGRRGRWKSFAGLQVGVDLKHIKKVSAHLLNFIFSINNHIYEQILQI